MDRISEIIFVMNLFRVYLTTASLFPKLQLNFPATGWVDEDEVLAQLNLGKKQGIFLVYNATPKTYFFNTKMLFRNAQNKKYVHLSNLIVNPCLTTTIQGGHTLFIDRKCLQ
jgi:hypothetical protein